MVESQDFNLLINTPTIALSEALCGEVVKLSELACGWSLRIMGPRYPSTKLLSKEGS